MKKSVPLKKELNFKSNLAQIVSISLDKEFDLEGSSVKGNLLVSGSYKMNDVSVNTEPFSYNIPVNIELSDRYILDNLSIDIDDFYYEIIDNNVLSLHFEIGLSNLEEIKEEEIINPIKYEVDGYTVLVGRNNIENDWLTLSFASKKDFWFHVKDVHGSHVILRTDLSDVADSTLVKCAQIAAKHSKASLSSNVPVDYCLVQFVKKPHGSKPGMVIFTNNKTLNVNP